MEGVVVKTVGVMEVVVGSTQAVVVTEVLVVVG